MTEEISIFVSYAHQDQTWFEDFVKRFRIELGASRKYDYKLWNDTEIAVGEKWSEEIKQAMEACDFGLLLVSPAFLGSTFIDQHELPNFIGESAKPIIPVMLKPISFGRHDLKGLEEFQIFRLGRRKAFIECTTSPTRDRFVQQLFEQIELRLDRLVATT